MEVEVDDVLRVNSNDMQFKKCKVIREMKGKYESNNTYDISLSDDGIILTIDVIEIDSQIADISGNWLVIECDDDRLKLVREIQDTVVEMVLEQDCEDDEEEECSEEDVSMYLQECFWYSGSNLMNNNDYSSNYQFIRKHE